MSDPKLAENSQASVDFSLDNVNYDDLIDPTVIRLFGITPESLAKKKDITDSSLLDHLVLTLISILDINRQTDPKANLLKVITLRSFVDSSQKLIPNQIPDFSYTAFGTDVYFYARQNGKLVSSRQIYSSMTQSMSKLASNSYTVNLNSFLFDVCQLESSRAKDFCPASSECKQAFVSSRQTLTADANATAIVSMDNKMDAECFGSLETMRTCFNNGVLVQSAGGSDYYCKCPADTEGPRCEVLSLTFKFR